MKINELDIVLTKTGVIGTVIAKYKNDELDIETNPYDGTIQTIKQTDIDKIIYRVK